MSGTSPSLSVWARIDLFSPVDGALEYLPAGAAGLSHLLPEQARLKQANCEEAFVRHRGLAVSQVGSRCSDSRPQILGISLIIYLETKRHCLPEQSSLLLPFFMCFISQPSPGAEGKPNSW